MSTPRPNPNSFGARHTVDVAGDQVEIYRLDAVDGAGRLPYSLKVLLENLLRTEDGANVTADHIRALADWDPNAEPDTEIQFTPGPRAHAGLHRRAVRRRPRRDARGDASTSAATRARSTRSRRPSSSSTTRSSPTSSARRTRSRATSSSSTSATASATSSCAGARQAFDDFKVVPPDTGIVHQVNLEYLARVVFASDGDGVAYPDTLVGTDSHTTMVNGLGVLGWGVGGIEAEAAMLGQPVVDADPAGRRLQAHRRAARGRDRDRPRAHRHRDAAQARRRRQVRRVLRRRASPPCRSPTAPRSAT